MNIGNPHELPVRRIADEIRRLITTAGPVAHVQAAVDDPQRRCPDITLASDVLDWRPRVPLHDGLERTVAWFARELGSTRSAS